ncbi:MAG TPA: DUF4249 domain-containing protein [Cyclobacteriaceae bacterium]|nr:DUF4249 domain-containing protein [Cyclobacteriaceae bacterium]HRW98910.1 DUF4249 domain-containing protein [Cyclobacteriaceae bacterium]
MRTPISIISFLLLVACVDRISVDATGDFQSQIVVDGFISDDPGPYTVRLFRSSPVDDNLSSATPFSARTVSIFDNLGNTETLSETANGSGVYVTRPTGIRGVIGRTYTLRIENRDGAVYESTPELIRPPGTVDSIYYVFETRTPLNGSTEYGYRVFLDARGADDSKYLRWKFNGTYRVETNPEQRTVPFGQGRIPDPPPCSGYIYTGALTQVGNCNCCVCWVKQVEKKPVVSDNQFVIGGKFTGVEIAYVPVDEFTFFDRYRIEIEQLSLSKEAFDFWRSIASQKDGATSLFQPSFGEVKTNVFPVNGGPPVLGIFYASGKARKSVFITKAEVPINVPPPATTIPEACNQVFDLSTTIKPFGWP